MISYTLTYQTERLFSVSLARGRLTSASSAYHCWFSIPYEFSTSGKWRILSF